MMQSAPAVVVVEDDRRVRDSLQSVLQSAGYEVEIFASAEAFLDSAARTRARCVIADVRLPGIDGLELQRRLRMESSTVPVIIVTAHDEDDVRQQALEGGAVAFMAKPFDAAELIDRVGAAWHLGR